MLKVRYEEYHNDYFRRNHEKSFSNLQEMENWIFDQMQQDYTKGRGMYFHTPKKDQQIHGDGASRIEFTPKFGGPTFWIHMIEDYGGIIFSDGSFTAGQKHWSRDVQSWLEHCDVRQHTPKFNVVE